MARISRRHICQAANASVLAAALALPAGLSIAAANSQGLNGGTAGAPAQTTEPPPSPPGPSDPTGPETPPSPSADSDPPIDPDTPTEETTSPPSTPNGTPDTTQPTGPGTTDEPTSDTSPEQNAGVDEATTSLTEEKERVPEELTGTVEALITIVTTVDSPETLPQDKQGIIESAENLSVALAAISDPRTPPELRKELTAIVKQVTAALEAFNAPGVPPEERSMLILVAKRTTSTLDMICDPDTPQDVRDPMIATVKDTTYAAMMSHSGSPAGSTDATQPTNPGPQQDVSNNLVPVSSSSEIVQDRRTPPKEREELAKITQQVSALLKRISDPRTSPGDRSKAKKELDEKTSRMRDQQEDSASAQKRPEESLGKAAAFCTSAIFETTRESDLMAGLERLVPAQWEDEGVKDFWKAEEKSNDMLEVLAQLRNNEHTHGPFEVVPLVTALAELVPRDELFGTLGGSALSCRQTAKYLNEEGITVGTWPTKTSE
ncbi:hypothetical protein [Streptomyces marokkonensis]|uniref:hypothetical protein n=1 Tax=Streptomyces marokkonensis TaxID=324855 RepID=UPI0011F2CD5D|nr:hypothetical protein [Streptomyces marokkonensis]